MRYDPLIPDERLRQMFPSIATQAVPPQPDHVHYDLRVPAFADKLEVLGGCDRPILWFTHARPLKPLTENPDGRPWLWLEKGPVLWVVDLWFDRSRIACAPAARIAMNIGIKRGIVQPDEEVLFYRNSGRYGRMVAKET